MNIMAVATSTTSLDNNTIKNLVSEMVKDVASLNLNKESQSHGEVKPVTSLSGEKLMTPKSATELNVHFLEPTHPLQYKWVLWYLHSDNTKKAYSWEENLKQIAVITTVEEFWALFNHLSEPSNLQRGCDYYFFKEGIKPMWEDRANVHGGRWLLFIDRKTKKLDEYWLELLLAIVGEQFEDYGNDICGIVVNARSKADKLSIWTADAQIDPVNMRIGEILKKKLGIPDSDVIQYESHRDASNRSNSTVKARLQIPKREAHHNTAHHTYPNKERENEKKDDESSDPNNRGDKNDKYAGKREWRNRRLQRIESK